MRRRSECRRCCGSAHSASIYSHEPNKPAHVHVDRGDATIKVWLEPVEVAKSRGFRAHEIGGIVVMVEEHRERLLEAWHEYFG